MSNILFFDLETSGLPVTKAGWDNYYNPAKIKYYDSSRIVEIAYIIFDKSGKEIKKISSLIIPDKFTITNSKYNGGITTEMATKYGVSMSKMLDILIKDLITIDTLISHNIKFDIFVLLSECYRLNNKKIINIIKDKKYNCTMKLGKQFMNCYKNPKLIELYEFLFKKKYVQKHRALDDTRLCSLCYFIIVNTQRP